MPRTGKSDVVLWTTKYIATTKVVLWHKPIFLRILRVVRWSMIELVITITDLHKVLKTLRILREVSVFQDEAVSRESGFWEESVEY